MPQGLQVWDAQGNLTVALTDKFTKIIGSAQTNTSTGGGFIVDDRLLQGNGGFVIPLVSSINYQQTANFFYPTFTVSGNRVNWTRSSAVIPFSYGVY